MKFLKKSIYALSLVSMMGLWSCSQEEMLPGGDVTAKGHPVPVTLTVSRSDAQTRTELSENTETGGLNDVWKDGDKLAVYSEDGLIHHGYITITDGQETSVGVFSGTLENVSDGEADYYLWYSDPTNDRITVDKDEYNVYRYNFNFYDQGYTTIKELSAMDLLNQKIRLSVNGNKATVVKTYTMQAKLPLVHFTLGGDLAGATGTLKIYDDNRTVKCPVTSGYVRVTGMNGKNPNPGAHDDSYTYLAAKVTNGEVYMAMQPTYSTNSEVKLRFEFEKDGKTYTKAFTSTTALSPGYYYSTELVLETQAASGSNPGNVASWASENLDPIWHREPIAIVATAHGWTLNDSNLGAEHFGGFSYYVGYDQNGITNGLLTSKKHSNFDCQAIFYQWGRWLGFPFCANYIYTYDQGDFDIATADYWGDYTIYPEMLPLGVDYGDTKIGYSWANSLSGAYVSTYMGGNNSWTKQRAINCSICYGLGTSLSGHLDYVYSNEDCTWEERGYNPAPDGYAIPSADQISALIPEGNQVASNTVQYKTIAGVRYAMRWKKVTTNVGTQSLPAVEISSFATTDTGVKYNDTRFDGVTPVRLVAFGCLNNEGDLTNEGKYGYYWTSDSDENALSNTSGYGGVVLVVNLSGSNIKMELTVLPRTFAANVYLIKDDSKKSDSIKPWFPLTGVGTPHW